jgi:hypothetical protein
MPRNFDGSTGYIWSNVAGGAAVSAYPCSIAVWIKPDINTPLQSAAGVSNSGSATPFIIAGVSDAGKAIAQARQDDGNQVLATGTTTLSVGTEYCLVATFTSNGTPKIYLYQGGAGGLENTGSAATGNLAITVTSTDIGALVRNGAQFFFDGLVGHAAFWDTEIDSSVCAALGAGADPSDYSPTHYFTVNTNADPELDEIPGSPSISLSLFGTAPFATPDFPVGVSPQLLAPIQDISAGTWLPSAGSPAELWQMIDGEKSPDSDYDYTTSAGTMEVKLSPGSTPSLQTGHTLRYRLRGNGTCDALVKLKCGSTVIAQWTESNVPAVDTDYSHTLDSSPSFSITDYTDLRISVEAIP